MLNTCTVIASDKDIVVIATIEETFNIVSGDVDQKVFCQFYNKNNQDIGYAKVVSRGHHQYISGDYNGKNLLHRFDFLTK